MMAAPPLAVLTVPGYTGSGPLHWQTLWERRNPEFSRVLQDDWDRPDCATWVASLDGAIRRQPAPVLLVAHSCGAATAVHWAARHGAGPVSGALLVAPPDADASDMIEPVRTFAPLPLGPLPFPTILAAGDDDPFLPLHRARTLATQWGSKLEVFRRAGHLNTASGHGPWPEGRRLLADLLEHARTSAL